jgi:hypothetical protein
MARKDFGSNGGRFLIAIADLLYQESPKNDNHNVYFVAEMSNFEKSDAPT